MYNQIDSNKRKTRLLIAIFFAVVIGIGYAFAEFGGYGYGTVVIAVVFSLVTSLVSYYHSDKIALASSGAKQIQKEDISQSRKYFK